MSPSASRSNRAIRTKVTIPANNSSPAAAERGSSPLARHASASQPSAAKSVSRSTRSRRTARAEAPVAAQAPAWAATSPTAASSGAASTTAFLRDGTAWVASAPRVADGVAIWDLRSRCSGVPATVASGVRVVAGGRRGRA